MFSTGETVGLAKWIDHWWHLASFFCMAYTKSVEKNSNTLKECVVYFISNSFMCTNVFEFFSAIFVILNMKDLPFSTLFSHLHVSYTIQLVAAG